MYEFDPILVKIQDELDLIPLDNSLFAKFVRPDWFDEAKCSDRENQRYLSTMYPERSETPGGKHLIPARKLCLNCPVRYTCLDYGLEDPFGIWGGHSFSQRRRIAVMVKSGSSLEEASRSIDARSRDAR